MEREASAVLYVFHNVIQASEGRTSDSKKCRNGGFSLTVTEGLLISEGDTAN